MRIGLRPLLVLGAVVALALAGCGPAVERPPLLTDADRDDARGGER